MVAYLNPTQQGPAPGTPQPPEAPNSTGNTGGRPSQGGGTNPIAQSMQQWMGQPNGRARMGGTPAQPQARPPMQGPPQAPPSPAPPQPSSGAPAPPAPQGAMQPGMPQAPSAFPSIPTQEQIAQLPPGSYQTPMGTLVKPPDGSPAKVVLNSAGQQLWRTRYAEAHAAFGDHPFSGDPGAPPPPIQPGKPAFNPFSGRWAGTVPEAPTGGR